jgi:hypothetical protein
MNRFDRFNRLSVATLVAASCALISQTASGESQRVVSVEEHWELRISEPDLDRSAPQTTMVMSPTPDLDGVHFLVTLNHATVPGYAAGGIQVQLWNGDDFVDSQTVQEGTTLDHAEEVVTWVQRMSLHDDNLKFQVRDGQSESWGAFGSGELSFNTSTSLTALNSYRPGVSLAESQVCYAENRVVSLTLMKLVWVTEDGVTHEQSAPIPIDTSLDE